MKVLCLHGGPRGQGSTSKALTWVEEELLADRHEVEHVDIADRELGGCIGCYRCQEDPEELVCAVEDDAVEPAVEAVLGAARTGRIGDGKIFVEALA